MKFSSRSTASKLPTSSTLGRRSLLTKSNRSSAVTSKLPTFSSKITKPREKKDVTVSSVAKNLLQGFKMPAPKVPTKGMKQQKTQNTMEKRGILKPVENIQKNEKTKSPDKSDDQFEVVFEEDPAALASILNNEGVSSDLLKETQIKEAKKEGKTPNEFLLFPDGRPSLCRRVPTNRTSVITSRPSAGPGRVERTSTAGRSPSFNPRRSSFRTSTRDSLYSFVERRYSQRGNSSMAPPTGTGRPSIISSAKPRQPPKPVIVEAQGNQNAANLDEKLQMSLARRVLKRNQAHPAHSRVDSPINPVLSSPALRVQKSGKTPGRAYVRWADDQGNSPKMKDNVAVALFQDEENISPEKKMSPAKAKPQNPPQGRKSISRLKPVTQCSKRQSLMKNKPPETHKPRVSAKKQSKLPERRSGPSIPAKVDMKVKKKVNEEVATQYVKVELADGEEIVEPKVLNQQNTNEIVPQKRSTQVKQEVQSSPHDSAEFLHPKTINANPPRSKVTNRQAGSTRVSKIPSVHPRKVNVDIDDVLNLMHKKMVAIKRRSVQAEFSSVIKSVEMSLASVTSIKEEDETQDKEGSPKTSEPVKTIEKASPQTSAKVMDESPKAGVQSWKEVLAAESNSPTWKEILSKESKSPVATAAEDATTKTTSKKSSPQAALSAPAVSKTRIKMPIASALGRRQTTRPDEPSSARAETQAPVSSPPVLSEIDQNDVARQLRESYEESLRQLEETEAEKRRIEEKMKRLSLEKKALEEASEKSKDPPKPSVTPLSDIESIKNRIFSVLDSKVSPMNIKTSLVPSTKPASDATVLKPPLANKYFGPILSPQILEDSPITIVKKDTANGVNSGDLSPPSKMPQLVKPEIAKNIVWNKSDKKEKKITSGRIGQGSQGKDKSSEADENPERCPVTPVISPSNIAMWKTKTPKAITGRASTSPAVKTEKVVFPEFPSEVFLDNVTNPAPSMENRPISPRKSTLSSAGSLITDSMLQNATFFTPFLEQVGMSKDQIKDLSLNEFLSRIPSEPLKSNNAHPPVPSQKTDTSVAPSATTSKSLSPSMWSQMSERERATNNVNTSPVQLLIEASKDNLPVQEVKGEVTTASSPYQPAEASNELNKKDASLPQADKNNKISQITRQDNFLAPVWLQTDVKDDPSTITEETSLTAKLGRISLENENIPNLHTTSSTAVNFSDSAHKIGKKYQYLDENGNLTTSPVYNEERKPQYKKETKTVTFELSPSAVRFFDDGSRSIGSFLLPSGGEVACQLSPQKNLIDISLLDDAKDTDCIKPVISSPEYASNQYMVTPLVPGIKMDKNSPQGNGPVQKSGVSALEGPGATSVDSPLSFIQGMGASPLLPLKPNPMQRGTKTLTTPPNSGLGQSPLRLLLDISNDKSKLTQPVPSFGSRGSFKSPTSDDEVGSLLDMTQGISMPAPLLPAPTNKNLAKPHINNEYDGVNVTTDGVRNRFLPTSSVKGDHGTKPVASLLDMTQGVALPTPLFPIQPNLPTKEARMTKPVTSLLDITHAAVLPTPLVPIHPTSEGGKSSKSTSEISQVTCQASPEVNESRSPFDSLDASAVQSGHSTGIAKPIFSFSQQATSSLRPSIAAPKPIKPPPPKTPAAFRMMRAKLGYSPSRSPYSILSPSRGISKSSRRKPKILTSSPSIRSVCTRRFAEALLDEEVALFTCRNFRTPVTPRRKSREASTSNPLGRVLMEGDDNHFIPISPIPMVKKQPKSNIVKGSAFSAFNPAP